jgi:hypothetical protein
MEETKKKFPLSIFEIVSAIILLPIVFYFSIKLLCEPINEHSPNWFFGFWGVLLILGFDCLWFVIMKLCPSRMLRIKIYTSMIVIVISLSILTCRAVLNMLSGVW